VICSRAIRSTARRRGGPRKSTDPGSARRHRPEHTRSGTTPRCRSACPMRCRAPSFGARIRSGVAPGLRSVEPLASDPGIMRCPQGLRVVPLDAQRSGESCPGGVDRDVAAAAATRCQRSAARQARARRGRRSPRTRSRGTSRPGDKRRGVGRHRSARWRRSRCRCRRQRCRVTHRRG
jgi:hypothetical protein